MDRIVATTHYQYELIDMASFMPPAYRFVTLGHDVVDPADKLGCKVEEFEDVSIYGLSEDVFRRCALGLERVNRIDRGAEALSPAVLMSIVATFDSNIADLVRDMISLKPALLNAGIKTVPVSEVLKSGSLDEIKDRILMDEIYQFSRGSHEEQVNYVERNFHVEIQKHWKRWPDFIEIFERRNLIAHGETKFTARYVSICSRHGHKGS
jgi:hypothetical protein